MSSKTQEDPKARKNNMSSPNTVPLEFQRRQAIEAVRTPLRNNPRLLEVPGAPVKVSTSVRPPTMVPRILFPLDGNNENELSE